MSPELTKKLLTRFPVLYQDYYSSMQETCMCWGFDTNDGWYDILWQLSLAIEDELGYTKFQKWKFLFLNKWSKRWNYLVYKLSPPVRDKYKMVGKGTKEEPYRQELVEKVYPRDQWLRNLLVKLLPDKQEDFSSVIGSWQNLGFKALVWHPDTGFKVSQVKEKFGELRYYHSGSSERIHTLVRMAEYLSSVTCEQCGEPGKLRGKGWLKTECDKCSGEVIKSCQPST
jgi:hypothetical protein